MRTKEQITNTIDHAVLRPEYTVNNVIEGCRVGKDYGVASVCVRPTDIVFAKKELLNSNVGLSTVIGFPHGANRSEVKVLEAELAIKDGATELDMVMNIGMFLSGLYNYVKKDIFDVVRVAKPHNVIVKVILETFYLSSEQISEACIICKEAGADYVKTSTGFASGVATFEAVEIMFQTVGDCMGVKASGGIKDYQTLEGYLKQGCKRIGTSSTKSILDNIP